jgi:lactate permease
MWTQVYDPLNSPVLSPLLAAVPVVLLLGLLATGRVSAQMAALAGLSAALLVAIFAYIPQHSSLDPVFLSATGWGGACGFQPMEFSAWLPTMLAAAGYGAAFGLLPIGWIVLAAIFLYSMTVETGQFEIVKHSVASLSEDRRIQALLIAFSFGAFVEGAAGFGTPVAISAALMMGAGFKPLYAAGLALLANTSPVAFGALGTPIVTLANVTGLDELKLSAMAGRQLPFFSLIVPVWLVWVMAGWRGVVGVWPALLVCGGSFALVQCLVANLHGPSLVDVAGGLVSMVALILFLRIWRPRSIWKFPEEVGDRLSAIGDRPSAIGRKPRAESRLPEYSSRQVFYAWVPWLLLTAFVFCWGLPPVKKALGSTSVTFQVPGLHNRIARDKPIVVERKIEEAKYDFNWLGATGSGIFLAAIASAFWLGIAPLRFVRIFMQTCYRMRWPLFTISCMLAIAYTTRYSGMDATLGLAFTKTGALYPLFAAMLGWLGVALTGSDTSSNALFGSLQTITAGQLSTAGGPLSHLYGDPAKILLATANSTGGVMGKMIDAQSIVVAAAATGQHRQEGPILRFVFFHSLILALLMGVLVLIQAYLWTWMNP